MITAIDTNVLSAIWTREPDAERLGNLLLELSREGALVVSGPVWVELAAVPGVGPTLCSQLLRALGIRIELELSRQVWDLAADAFSSYAERRRASGAGQPRRILADFLVGAHATDKTARLITLDGGFYRHAFPQLPLVAIPKYAPAR